MGKVKWGNIGLILVVLVLLGVGGFKLYQYFRPDTDATVLADNRSNSSPNSPTSTTSNVPSAPLPVAVGDNKPVSVTPPNAPVNPTRKGVAMLGGSGVFKYIADTDGTNATLVSRDLSKELVKEGMVDPETIRNIVKNYIVDMQNGGVVGAGNFQFIVASSALADDKDGKIAKLGKTLEKFYTVTYTTSAQEGQYAARVAIPPQYRNSSFLVDVTPSLTRVTWFEGNATRTTVISGSKYLIDGKSDDAMLAEIAKLNIPESNRRYGYIIWAAMEKPNATERYTALADSYETTDRNYQGGLNILQAIRKSTGAEMFFDSKSAYPIGFLMTIK